MATNKTPLYRLAGGTESCALCDHPHVREHEYRCGRVHPVGQRTRVLRENFATRLARALTRDDFAAVFADADQLSLFGPSIASMQPVLQRQASAY